MSPLFRDSTARDEQPSRPRGQADRIEAVARAQVFLAPMLDELVGEARQLDAHPRRSVQ
jgi:hypothetical protein